MTAGAAGRCVVSSISCSLTRHNPENIQMHRSARRQRVAGSNLNGIQWATAMPGLYKVRWHQQSRRATRRQPRLALSLRLRAKGILTADARRRFISVGNRFGVSWSCVEDSRSSNACDARGLVSGRASS